MNRPLPPPPAALLVRPGERAMRLGMVGAASGRPARDRGEIWIVCHAAGDGGAGWAHLYRIDPREERTVHLERAVPGGGLAALRRWARVVLCVEAAGERGALAA